VNATILALNPGSSSVKAAVRAPRLVLSLHLERLGTPQGRLTVEVAGDRTERQVEVDGPGAVDVIAAELSRRRLHPAVVAHRVVHGGSHHHAPTEVDDALLADLRAAIPLAPLHLPAGIEMLVRARRTWSDATHVACFDTGFHHGLPEWSRRLPVAPELERVGVRRYGFHGLSLQSVLHSHPNLGDAVVAHLGSGCSVTAVAADGTSRHTTMSLTPTGGMMSATRTGDLDPEIVLYLIDQGFTVPDLRRLMDRQSGLAGYAGGRHDLRDLLAAGDPEAALAIEAFVRSAAAAIATCATALDRWSSLVFTGGVGAHAATVRERICGRVLVLRGAVAASGDAGSASAALAARGLRVLAVESDEEAELDRLARRLAC
jgi:acetate kinase